MGNFAFRLPDIGEGVAEAEIVAWRVKVGDLIDEDQLTVDVMTDKATVEMTSPVSGRVVSINGGVGQRVPVGTVLFELETDCDLETQGGEPKPASVSEPITPEPPIQSSGSIKNEESRISAVPRKAGFPLASPATRRSAYEHGVDLDSVRGTGPAGRITAADLERHLSDVRRVSHRPGAKREEIVETKIVGLRRMIAEKMQEAKRRIPHFTYVEEFDVTELDRLRQEINGERPEHPRLTFLPFFMRAIVRLIPEFPNANSRFDDEGGVLRRYAGVHIGIATQTASGLVVPVVRHAEARDLFDCAAELSRVTAAAREGKAARDELSGSTITLTSLGALGGVSATPIINHPEVAIIGPNKAIDRPVFMDGQVARRKIMNVSSSFDHRIIDGYEAARFVQALKRLIEQPGLIFVDRT